MSATVGESAAPTNPDLSVNAETEPGKTADLLTRLSALANPTRLRLYEYLMTYGATTVSGLAAHLGLAVGSVSYHLRQLHALGLVVELQDRSADRRERWWEAAPGGVRWTASDLGESTEARAIDEAAEALLLNRQLEYLQRWKGARRSWGPMWSDAALSQDTILHLSREELELLGAELGEVLRKWRQRHREPSDASVPVLAAVHTLPMIFRTPDDDS